MLKKIKKFYYYLCIYPIYKIRLGKIGRRTRLVAPMIDGHKRIFLGNNIFIHLHAWLAADPVTGDSNCKLEIGDGTYVGRFSHIYASSSIIIGKKVLIADKVYISDNLHGHQDVSVPVIDQPVQQTAPVSIGDGAWLGENVSVIGASVGKQSVIGAHAVVTKDIPDYCVAVGIPARIIKKYDFEKQEWRATDNNGNFTA
jgi:acetyltransferase-like isoleucine patch superfamily enzyme